MKKSAFLLSILLLGTSIQIWPSEKLKGAARIAGGIAIAYTGALITTIAHEYGHALVYWYNSVPSRVIINATQKRIEENMIEMDAESELKNEDDSISFPAIEINLMPSLYSACVAKQKLNNKKQDILCSAAGPIAGATASVLLNKIFPSIFTKTDCYAGVISQLINFLPIKLFGLRSDGYQILEQLNIV